MTPEELSELVRITCFALIGLLLNGTILPLGSIKVFLADSRISKVEDAAFIVDIIA